MGTGSASGYDVGGVRAHFPALREGAAHFDGPGGSQTPDVVGEAVAGALCAASANHGTVTPAERRAAGYLDGGRAAMADLLAADPRGIVFGRSMTQLTYDVSRALAKTWRAGDEVVVTRLDHDANVRPWVQAAAAAGATLRWADFDPASTELTVADVTAVLSDRTRLVAFTGASNLLGTRPDVRAVADAVHAAGGLTYVDGVHLTPHATVDVTALGADFYACSPYKFLGPHLGALAADPDLLETLHPDKLRPSSDAVPARFEFGTPAYEQLAGVTAAVDFLAGLVPGEGGRRARLVRSFAALEEHERALQERLEKGLAERPGVTVLSRAAHRTPTVTFLIDGVPSQRAYAALAEQGVNAPAGSFYAVEAAARLGLDAEGAVRAGIAPYTDESDVDRLLAGVHALTG